MTLDELSQCILANLCAELSILTVSEKLSQISCKGFYASECRTSNICNVSEIRLGVVLLLCAHLGVGIKVSHAIPIQAGSKS